MPGLGKTLLIVGLALAGLGLLMLLMDKLPPGWPRLFRLPGDIDFKGKNVRFYFPIVTSLVISIILTIIVNLFRK